MEEVIEEERRVARLGRDPRHPRDVHVRAARSIEEIDVAVDRGLVAADPERQPALHPIEEERHVALGDREAHGLARARRHEDLGIDARHRHPRRHRHRCRQHAVGDQEDVRIELGAFVAGAHEVDDAVEMDGAAVGERGAHDDHVVELEIGVAMDALPRSRAEWRPGCRAPGRPGRRGRARRHMWFSSGMAARSGRGERRASRASSAVIARRMSSRSPSRWRRLLSSPPRGTRFCGERGSRSRVEAARSSAPAPSDRRARPRR